jgi:hypothetical protein
MHLGHKGAVGAGVLALQSHEDGDPQEAASWHGKAARMHEKAATNARRDGDEDEAQEHDNAAALHRKAASLHSSLQTTANRADVLIPPVINWQDGSIHSFDGYPGSQGSQEPYANPQYGPAPRVRRSDQRSKVTPQPEKDEDDLLIPMSVADLFDGRHLGRVKRQSKEGIAGSGEREVEEENERRMSALSTNALDPYGGVDPSNILPLPRMTY